MDFPLPTNYIAIIRRKAKAEGYDPKQLFLATDGIHKAEMRLPDQTVRFGKLGMADYNLLKIMERNGTIPAGEAMKRRTSYLKRSAGIKGDWASNKYSPNSLARKILW
jgi:hypothetical protein